MNKFRHRCRPSDPDQGSRLNCAKASFLNFFASLSGLDAWAQRLPATHLTWQQQQFSSSDVKNPPTNKPFSPCSSNCNVVSVYRIPELWPVYGNRGLGRSHSTLISKRFEWGNNDNWSNDDRQRTTETEKLTFFIRKKNYLTIGSNEDLVVLFFESPQLLLVLNYYLHHYSRGISLRALHARICRWKA